MDYCTCHEPAPTRLTFDVTHTTLPVSCRRCRRPIPWARMPRACPPGPVRDDELAGDVTVELDALARQDREEVEYLDMVDGV